MDSAPDCLICQLTRTLHETYAQAVNGRRALKYVPRLGEWYERNVRMRPSYVASDLVTITRHSHNGA